MASEIPSGSFHNPLNRAVILKQKVTSTLTASLKINNQPDHPHHRPNYDQIMVAGESYATAPAVASADDPSEDRISDRRACFPRGGFVLIKGVLLGAF